jgi:hypothetical protein
MRLFLSIIVTAFALMGLFALLRLWNDRVRPVDEKRARDRRSVLALIGAAVGGILIGSYWWHVNRRARRQLQLLFDLEVLLAQLEGLVNASLAQQDVTKLLPLIKTLVEKLGEYGSKTTPLFTELESELSYGDFADLRLGASIIAYALDQIQNPTSRDLSLTGDNNPLIAMQKGIRLARAKTRELIDART